MKDEKNKDIENISDDELVSELGKAYIAVNRLNKSVSHRTILLNLERKMRNAEKLEEEETSRKK